MLICLGFQSRAANMEKGDPRGPPPKRMMLWENSTPAISEVRSSNQERVTACLTTSASCPAMASLFELFCPLVRKIASTEYAIKAAMDNETKFFESWKH